MVAGSVADADKRGCWVTGLTCGPAAAAEAELSTRLTPANLAVEVAYLGERPGFERPYGWAWAAMLAAACQRCPVPAAAEWARATAPLAEQIAELVPGWLAIQAYPVRHGTHGNSAFALRLLLAAYRDLGQAEVVRKIERAARAWFGTDHDYPTAFEPSGQNFLSPALCEAELMRMVLAPAEFSRWLTDFLPGLGGPAHARLLEVPQVRDRTDGHAVHLFGLALSRAWQLRALAGTVAGQLASGRSDQSVRAAAVARATAMRAAADAQAAFALPEVTGGDFMSTHWLVSFALLARTAEPG